MFITLAQNQLSHKAENNFDLNHDFILLEDGSEPGESFSAGLGHKEPNKKCPKAADRPMEEEDGVQSKGTDEVRQQLHQNYCCDIPGGEDHNTPKNFPMM